MNKKDLLPLKYQVINDELRNVGMSPYSLSRYKQGLPKRLKRDINDCYEDDDDIDMLFEPLHKLAEEKKLISLELSLLHLYRITDFGASIDYTYHDDIEVKREWLNKEYGEDNAQDINLWETLGCTLTNKLFDVLDCYKVCKRRDLEDIEDIDLTDFSDAFLVMFADDINERVKYHFKKLINNGVAILSDPNEPGAKKPKQLVKIYMENLYPKEKKDLLILDVINDSSD